MPLGRRIAKMGLRAGAGSMVAGPFGAVAGIAAPTAWEVGKLGRNTMKMGALKSEHAFLKHSRNTRFADSKALHTMSRHPFMTAAGAYTVGSVYNQMPGANRSRRNQNDWYLNRVRRHQRSSALSGLMGNSMGGMTL